MTLQLTRWLCLIVLSSFSLAYTQSDSAQLELGFAGEVVADTWNPVRLVLRDQPAATLRLTFEHGGFIDGELRTSYQADIPAGRGLYVFEDDVYFPSWRRLIWTLSTDERLLASGSIDRRPVNPDPLHIIVSANPGRWRALYDTNDRVIDSSASYLPERSAAYAGVASLLIDGTAAAPRLQALAAASAAGATVILLDPLPDSHNDLNLLSNQPTQRVANGWVIRTPENGVKDALEFSASFVSPVLAEALFNDTLLDLPASVKPLSMLIAAAVFSVVVLLLVRFGSVPGLLTGVLLMVVACFAGWSLFRPDAAQFVRSRSVSVSAGSLALTTEVRSLFRFPAGTLSLPVTARPTPALAYEQHQDELVLSTGRWQRVNMVLRPSVRPAVLHQDDGVLSNTGSVLLTDVYVKGVGRQAPLEAGARQAISAQEDAPLPEVYDRLLPLLSNGTALGRNGGHIHIALPPAGVNANVLNHVPSQQLAQGWLP